MINNFITYGSYGKSLAIVFFIFVIFSAAGFKTIIINRRVRSSDKFLPFLSSIPIIGDPIYPVGEFILGAPKAWMPLRGYEKDPWDIMRPLKDPLVIF
jgi:hypothetical protein